MPRRSRRATGGHAPARAPFEQEPVGSSQHRAHQASTVASSRRDRAVQHPCRVPRAPRRAAAPRAPGAAGGGARSGSRRADLVDALVPLEPVAATRADLERVHPAAYLDRIEAHLRGRRRPARPRHVRRARARGEAATLAAGAGLTAVEALRTRRGRRGVLRGAPARAPRHAARSRWASASSPTSPSWPRRWPTQGERVLIVDYDAHHGNGTQDVFYDDPRVLFVSLHQWPLYPGTGRHDEIGAGAGAGFTMNIPLPAGHHRRRVPARVRRDRRAARRRVRADVADHLGRVRRPPRRSDHRARAHRRATTSPLTRRVLRVGARRSPARDARGRLRPRRAARACSAGVLGVLAGGDAAITAPTSASGPRRAGRARVELDRDRPALARRGVALGP